MREVAVKEGARESADTVLYATTLEIASEL
jgi:hypothetical protein